MMAVYGSSMAESIGAVEGHTAHQVGISAYGYLLPPRPSWRMSAVRSMSGRIARVRNGNSGSEVAVGHPRMDFIA
jgi:hypothetical protein